MGDRPLYSPDPIHVRARERERGGEEGKAIDPNTLSLFTLTETFRAFPPPSYSKQCTLVPGDHARSPHPLNIAYHYTLSGGLKRFLALSIFYKSVRTYNGRHEQRQKKRKFPPPPTLRVVCGVTEEDPRGHGRMRDEPE